MCKLTAEEVHTFLKYGFVTELVEQWTKQTKGYPPEEVMDNIIRFNTIGKKVWLICVLAIIAQILIHYLFGGIERFFVQLSLVIVIMICLLAGAMTIIMFINRRNMVNHPFVNDLNLLANTLPLPIFHLATTRWSQLQDISAKNLRGCASAIKANEVKFGRTSSYADTARAIYREMKNIFLKFNLVNPTDDEYFADEPAARAEQTSLNESSITPRL